MSEFFRSSERASACRRVKSSGASFGQCPQRSRSMHSASPVTILHLGRSGGRRIQFGAFGVMLGRKWRTGVMTKQSSGFRVSSSSAPRSSRGATSRRQPSPSCQSQGKIARPMFGVGWRRNPKPERFQPRSTGGVDRCVGIPSSFTGESGTSSPSSCGCRSPRSCGGRTGAL